MIGLYPIRFKPIFKERIWGGTKLKDSFNKDVPEGIVIGESWEISGFQKDISLVNNGYLAGNSLEEIIEVYMGDLVGDRIFEEFGNEFPLLIKLIDAGQDLSIQVHPDNKLALERHKAYGKTEMWYILDSIKGSKIYTGFKTDSDIASYKKALSENTLGDMLNTNESKAGDVFFIPPGRVHSAGAGNIIAEIQQTSDITYRIYDWGRTGLDGKARELHTDLALDAIDFKGSNDKLEYEKKNKTQSLLECDFFSTNLIQLEGETERDYSSLDSFVVYLCTKGSFTLEHDQGEELIKCGQSILVPAVFNNTILKGNADLLEIYIADTKKQNVNK